MQYVIKRLLFNFILIIILSSCGATDGNAPNLFGNMRVFVTSATHTGNLGGVTGADTKCMSDVNYPGDGNFRALISDGTNRTTNRDWVLVAGLKYVRALDNLVIGTTSENSIFTFPLTTSFITSGSTRPYWSGLNASWVGESGIADNCQNWTSANSSFNGQIGRAEDTANSAIYDSGVFPGCDNSFRLVCIEQ